MEHQVSWSTQNAKVKAKRAVILSLTIHTFFELLDFIQNALNQLFYHQSDH